MKAEKTEIEKLTEKYFFHVRQINEAQDLFFPVSQTKIMDLIAKRDATFKILKDHFASKGKKFMSDLQHPERN